MYSAWFVEELDFTFVVILGAVFMTVSLLVYYCDAEYRHNFYFEGGLMVEAQKTFNVRTKLNHDIIILSEVNIIFTYSTKLYFKYF